MSPKTTHRRPHGRDARHERATPYMTPDNVLNLWRARLSSRVMLVQECLAMLGIAVGVALLVAAQIASTSLSGSVQELTSQIVGHSQQFQLEARGPNGMDEGVLEEAARLPGVRSALPVLEQAATVIGPSGRQAVDLLGTTPRLADSDGRLFRRFTNQQLEHLPAIALPDQIASDIGAGSLQTVQIQIGARVVRTLLGATLGEGDIGGLAHSPVAIAPVAYAQKLAGTPRRVTRIFVRPAAGHAVQVERALRRLAARNNVNVDPADFDSTLFDVASNPETQSETLFSAISALVGFMFALTAILLTVPRRRLAIEEIRPHGSSQRVTFEILLFDALVLGFIGCALGLLLGDLLSLAAFHRAPGYLSSAFPVGNDRIVSLRSVALAVGAGGVSAIAGVFWPMRGVFMEPSSGRASRRWAIARIIVGAACVGVTTAILLARPQDAFLGSVTLILALVLLLPLTFNTVLAVFARLQRLPVGGAPTELTVDELDSPRIRVRALAIVTTGAIAVFGIVSIGGAQSSLRGGLFASAHAIDASADIWISPGGDSSVLATTPFADTHEAAIAHLPGVESVGAYRGSFFNWGRRRIWVLAPPANSRSPIPRGQLASGSLSRAAARVRGGRWAVLSQALAHEKHLRVGDSFTVPSQVPITLRVVALSTNLGWPPGAMILSSYAYARGWGSAEPSAFEVQVRSGFAAVTVRAEIERTLGRGSGLAVETRAERQARHYALARQGLSRLTQIKLLMLIAGVLAIAGALGSLIWQRRDRIAAIRVQGYSPRTLWLWLGCESALMLATGCCIGAVFGVGGQLLLSHALATVTGFPISLGVESNVIWLSFVGVGVIAFAIVSVPGYLVVHVAPKAASAKQ
jgi:putative ABC transport system permease protein